MAGSTPRSTGASTCHPSRASKQAKPTRYATATCQPLVSHAPTERACGNIEASATPADEPNQIIEPPKPTAKARKPQS